MEIVQAPEGDVIAEHGATLANRVFSVLFLVLPGLGLLFFSLQVDSDARAPMIVIGLVLAGLGGLAIVQQNKSKVVVRTDGVERWGLRGKLWAVRWQDAVELRYRAVKVRLGGLLGLLLPALTTNVYISLVGPDGKKRALPGNLKAMDVFSERVIEQHTTAHFAAARSKIDAGEELRFGKAMVLEKDRVSTKKFFGGLKSCPLPEIEAVSVQGGFLKIRQRGKTFDFASVATAVVPNVFLLLRLLESMLGQKKALKDRDFSSQAFVG
jgi:hypothetical protein